MLTKLVLVAALAYTGICLGLYLFQSRLVYFPSKSLVATPRQVGLDFEDVWLETLDGGRIHGWYVPAEDGKRTALFLHGNAGNISDRLDTLRELHRWGLNALIIDYRGYGRSDGKPGEQETYQDLAAAWRHLTETRGVVPGDIVLFGRSLGAAVAAWGAAEYSPGALILESPFVSVPELASEMYPVLPVRYLSRIRYDTSARLPDIETPVLIAHSDEDKLIPATHGRRLYAIANEPKFFLPMRGGHNDGFIVSGDDYRDGIADFLRLSRGDGDREPAAGSTLRTGPLPASRALPLTRDAP